MVGFIVDNVGIGELLLIALVALIVFGPEKTPELARKAGKLARKVKKVTNEFKREFEAMVDLDDDPEYRRPVQTAAPDRDMLKDIVKSKTSISPPEKSAAPIVPREEEPPDGQEDLGKDSGVTTVKTTAESIDTGTSSVAGDEESRLMH